MRDNKNNRLMLAAVSVIFIFQLIISAGIVSADLTGGESSEKGAKDVNTTFDRVVIQNNLLDKLDIVKNSKNTADFESSTRKVSLSGDESFERIVSECVLAAGGNFRGPGLYIKDCSVTVFDLIPDSDISSPEYLERERGIAIYLNYSSIYLNNLQRTLWVYEIDATSIVKEIYNCGLEKDTGFILISMSDVDGAIGAVKFKLTASDGLKYSGNINEGLYLMKTDWSSVELSPTSGLSLYEDPDTRIYSYDSIPFEDTKEQYIFLSQEEMREKIIERSAYLNGLAQKIFDLCLAGDWKQASLVSEELIDSSFNYIDETENFIFPSDMGDLKDEYIECLEAYSDASMCFWYGTTFLDDDKIKEGQSKLKESIERMNKIFESLEIKQVDESRIVKSSSVYLLPKTLRLTEVYGYKDSGGYNDISIRVENCGYKESYWLRNDEYSKMITADFDKKFFYVVVDVTHMGYRGGSTSRIKTPLNSEFTLFWMGDEYKDSTPKDYIRSIGVPYTQIMLNRREHFEAVLVYEVPIDFKKEDAYIKVNLGDMGTPMWCFEYPENSSLNPD